MYRLLISSLYLNKANYYQNNNKRNHSHSFLKILELSNSNEF